MRKLGLMLRTFSLTLVALVASGCSCSSNVQTDGGGGGTGGGGTAGGVGGGGGTGGAGGSGGGGAACAAATTCSGHGTCTAAGACQCDPSFTGPACATCSADHFNYPACTFCSAATTCSGHGACATTGGCSCAAGFGDAGCGECVPGFVGFPSCVRPMLESFAADFIHQGPESPDVAFGPDGGILVAHTILIGGFNTRLVVSTLVNGAWQQVGPAVEDAGTTSTLFRPSLVMTSTGPLVAFGESATPRTRRFNGTDWQPIDFGTGPTVGTTRALDMVLDSQGRPVAVFIPASGSVVQTRRLENGTWTALGAAFTIEARNVKIAIRPNDTIVAIVTTVIPPFGSGISVLEQTSGGTWSALGASPFDTIGDTTTNVGLGDIDVSATETVASWNKGTCNSLARFVAKPPTYTSFGEAGAIGADVQSVLDGAGLIQSYIPFCPSAQRSVQRWTGTAWNPPIALTPFMNSAELHSNRGAIYLGYQFGGASSGNVVRLNVP